MSAERRIPAAPKGSGDAGRRLWRAVHAYLVAEGLDLDPAEAQALEMACTQLDVVARLEVFAAGEPVTVKGSQGQPVAHPALVEARQGRATVASLLARLKITALPADLESPRSRSARKAAQVRWAHG